MKRVVMCMRDYCVFAVSAVVRDPANRTSDRGYFIGG